MYVGSSSATGGAVIAGYSVTLPSGLITTIAGRGSPLFCSTPPPLFSSVSAGLGPTPSSTLSAPSASGPEPPVPPLLPLSKIPPKLLLSCISFWKARAATSAFVSSVRPRANSTRKSAISNVSMSA